MNKENETSDKQQNGNDFITDVSHRLSELDKLKDWLDNLKESEHYCGYELDFGMDRGELYDYIEDRKRELNGC